MQRFAALALMALLPACATVVEGTSDTITLSTTPAGATCTVDRNGERVGAVAATPGSLRLSKSRHDLNVTCTKEGYQLATTTASSRFTGATFATSWLAASSAWWWMPPPARTTAILPT